jgi:hypothetical protein
MALKYSTAVRNAKLDAIEATIGASAKLRMWTGAAPANCAAADSGTKVAEMDLPADWMAAASNGSKAKSGTWQDTSADNAGTLGHFRIYNSDYSVCHMQGTITAAGGGGDMEVQNTNVAAGQAITITSFQINENNG